MNKRLDQAITAGVYSGSLAAILGFFSGAFILWPLTVWKAEASLSYGLLIGLALMVTIGGMNFLLWLFFPIRYF